LTAGILSVAIRIAADSAFDGIAHALPRVAAGVLGFLPSQVGIAPDPLPIALQFRFGIVE